MIAEGRSYRWIARDLDISKNTVNDIVKGRRQKQKFGGLILVDFRATRELLPYLWPKSAPALRRAVIYSLFCLVEIISKAAPRP